MIGIGMGQARSLKRVRFVSADGLCLAGRFRMIVMLTVTESQMW
jgi:hypothetical protein